MSVRSRVSVQAAVTGSTIAVGVLASLWLLLSALATPPGLAANTAALERKISMAEQLSQGAAGPIDHQVGAVCHQSPATAASAIKLRLQAASAAKGLSVSNLATGPATADEAQGGLVPVTFTLEASGRYDQAVLLIAALAKSQPEIFVDQADLKSQTSQVLLKLSGRLYCSTSAPL